MPAEPASGAAVWQLRRIETCDVADAVIENCADPAHVTAPSIDVPASEIK
jgi:hypothetical protein